LLWYGARLWGVALTAVLLLAPLELAALTASVVDVSPSLALVVGTLGAAALGLPPWTGETRLEADLAIGGVAASWLGWNLLRDPDAGPATALAMLALAVVALGTRLVAVRLRHRPTLPGA
jgi:hypothetical protein